MGLIITILLCIAFFEILFPLAIIAGVLYVGFWAVVLVIGGISMLFH